MPPFGDDDVLTFTHAVEVPAEMVLEFANPDRCSYIHLANVATYGSAGNPATGTTGEAESGPAVARFCDRPGLVSGSTRSVAPIAGGEDRWRAGGGAAWS